MTTTKISRSLAKCRDSQSEDEDDAAPEVVQDSNEPETWEQAPVEIRRNSADPTLEERARHDATHLQFRPWCPEYVEAWATEDPLYRTTAEEQVEGKAEICVDYCKLGDDLEDKTDKQEVLVARDKWSKIMHASVAECKGNEDEHIAKQLCNF